MTATQREILNQAFTAILPEYGLTAGSRLLALYPHSSAASTNCAFGPAWVLGATLIVDDVAHFTAGRFLSNIERYQVTHATAVPTMLVRILRHVEEAGLTSDVSSLQRVAYGSAPIAPSVTAKLIETFGPIFMQVYGMTEVSGICCTLRAGEHDASDEAGKARLRSCGKPVPGAEVEVVADDGLACAAGELGEVRIRSEFVMSEYWDDPLRTSQTLRGGWLYSGDIGRTDDAGYIYIVNRKKDLIISGGQNSSARRSRTPSTSTRACWKPPRSAFPTTNGASGCTRSWPSPMAARPRPPTCRPSWPGGLRRSSGRGPSISCPLSPRTLSGRSPNPSCAILSGRKQAGRSDAGARAAAAAGRPGTGQPGLVSRSSAGRYGSPTGR